MRASRVSKRIQHIHTVSKFIEVSREYKMPLCLTFIDLKKAFDSVETEAVMTISVHKERNAKVGMGRHGSEGDGRQLHHLRFADDIALITPSQAERMLNEFDETCGCIGLQLNLQKTMFMRNGWVSDAPLTLNGTNISECTSYVYLGWELNMMNDLTPELGRRRAAWGTSKSTEDVVKTRNTRPRAHLFNTTVLPALTYASETWTFRRHEENAVSVIERAIERVMLGVSCFTQVRDGIRSSLLRQRSKIRDIAAFAKESKIRRAGHVMCFNENRWTEPLQVVTVGIDANAMIGLEQQSGMLGKWFYPVEQTSDNANRLEESSTPSAYEARDNSFNDRRVAPAEDSDS
ncbi:hypothetical protein RB195_024186 [Necator americanus]|uniref:Reverse transcriptase domain-containing protein n=1 Tax=Necator americanus TaxID=51031 RepID=A0ABR1EN18_NECAM